MGDGPGRRARSIYAFGRSEACEPNHQQSRPVFRQYLPLRDSNLPSKKSPGIGEGTVSEIPLKNGSFLRLCRPHLKTPCFESYRLGGERSCLQGAAVQTGIGLPAKCDSLALMPIPTETPNEELDATLCALTRKKLVRGFGYR